MRLILSNSLSSFSKSNINLIPDLSFYLYPNRENIDKYEIIFSLEDELTEDLLTEKNKQISILKNNILNWATLNLNTKFSSNYSSRCWEILIGHWLERYINIILTKYLKLKRIFSENNISEIYFANTKLNILDLITDSNDFVTLSNSTKFNSLVYFLLYEEFFKTNDIKLIDENKIITSNSASFKYKFGFINGLKFYFNILFSQSNKYLLYNSFLSKRNEILLNLKFLQIPFLTYNLRIDKIIKKKCRIFEINNFNDSKNLEEFLKKYFFTFIPKTYSENFIELNNICKKIFPKHNPTLIFTSNSFDTDDIFKIYLILNVHSGAKYYVGQHGAQYGVNKFYLNSNEINTSDLFYTWGWGNQISTYKGVYLKKRLIKKNVNRKDILLIQKCIDHSITLYDNYYVFEKYMQDQFTFYNHLNLNIKNDLVVRLMFGSKNLNGFDYERWSNVNIRIDNGAKSISKVINNYKLLIFTYDSTIMYEAIDLGIPFIFISFEKYYISEEATPFFYKLKMNNIYFDDYEKAAIFINSTYTNLERWWNSVNVQNVLCEFKNKFANTSCSPVNSLINFININK